MSSGVLLDTHALYWLVTGAQPLSGEALAAIGVSQSDGALHVSPITAWELSLAVRKTSRAPVLGAMTAGEWFHEAVRTAGARIVAIDEDIAIEAADVVGATGHRDPGDCHIIATARAGRLVLVTRDATILALAARGYLHAIRC